MKKVLITGASGFIGRHCLPFLADSGFEIYASFHRNRIVTDYNINWISLNINNIEQTRQVLKEIKPTHLLHLAWYVKSGQYINSNQNIEWLNASLEMIRAFGNCGGQRIVTAGTCFERYTNTLYGTCKQSLAKVANAYGALNNFSTAHGRVFYLYGPYENKRRLIPYVVNQLLDEKPAHCSHGRQIRDFLYVVDVANAFVKILDSDITGTIDIGSGQGVMLKDVFNIIETQTKTNGLVKLGMMEVKSEPKMIVANNDALINKVGWKANYKIEEGIRETIEWWRGNGAQQR
jgi:nucleoside-diphosphate-sugar epimerase